MLKVFLRTVSKKKHKGTAGSPPIRPCLFDRPKVPCLALPSHFLIETNGETKNRRPLTWGAASFARWSQTVSRLDVDAMISTVSHCIFSWAVSMEGAWLASQHSPGWGACGGFRRSEGRAYWRKATTAAEGFAVWRQSVSMICRSDTSQLVTYFLLTVLLAFLLKCIIVLMNQCRLVCVGVHFEHSYMP